MLMTWYRSVITFLGKHGKAGNVMEFGISQGLTKNQGRVREKILSGKTIYC